MTLKGCILSGSPVTDSDVTILNTLNVVDVEGTIDRWCVYCGGFTSPSQARLKVFRDDGTNFIYIGQSNLETMYQSGINSFDTNIIVQAGDLIGLYPYSSGGQNQFYASDEGNIYYKSGNVISDSLKSSWTFGYNSGRFSLNTWFGIFVNSSTGNDTNAGDSCVAGHPVLTFQKAYDLLATDGTIHCCNSGADFSGETVTFTKGFSITVDGNGYCYLPVLS